MAAPALPEPPAVAAAPAAADEALLPADERAIRAVRRGATRAFRWLFAFLPTRRLVAAIAILSPLWMVTLLPNGAPWVIAALVLLFAVAVFDLLTTPAQWQVTVERRLPATIGIGDVEQGAYVVGSRLRRPLRVMLFDELPRGLVNEGEPRAPVAVPGEGTIELPIAVRGRERGVWALGPVVLRAAGRLGLVQRTLRWEPGDSVLVAPSLSGVRHYRLLTLQHRLRDFGVRAIRRRGEGTSFTNLREYVIGDDPRHVDWKATARRQKPIVREYSVEQGQTVMIAIDAGRLMTQLAGDVPRFEYALSSATLLADVAASSGDHVGLILFDDQVRAFVPPVKGAEAMHRIRQALIPATATMTEPDYAEAFRLLASRHRKRSLIVLFTDVIDPHASQSLIALTARSAQRHLLLVVALRNDQLMNAAVPTRSSSSTALFEAAAAEELVQARNEALARMRRAGVSVLDVSPQQMTAAVVNRYLDIKARSSL